MAGADKDAGWFAQRVAESEAAAAADEAAYRTRVRLWAMLGVAVVPVGTFILFAIGVLFGWYGFRTGIFTGYQGLVFALLCCGIPPLTFIWMMHVSIPAPDGVALAKPDCPRLFSVIEEVREASGAPKLDAVYLSKDLNAAVVQRPTFGLFSLLGGHRNELVLGLPLLQLLSEKEFAAVLAHEFGHISHTGDKAGALIHRSRMIWAKILDQTEGGVGLFGPILLKWFAGWYAPRLLAFSFAFARSNEFAADRLAAKVAGSKATASALSRFAIAAQFIESYWEGIWREPVEHAEPEALPYREMGVFLPKVTEWERAACVLESELAVPSGIDDTHPSLGDRLAMLAQRPALPPIVTNPAATLLGPLLDTLVDRFDAEWRSSVSQEWAQRHKELTADHDRLRELDTAARKSSLYLELAVERAQLTEKLYGIDAAQQAYVDCVEWHREIARAWLVYGASQIAIDPAAANEAIAHALELAKRRSPERYLAGDWFVTGQRLLAIGDELGIACLELASRLDIELIDESQYLIDAFHERRAAEQHLQALRATGPAQSAA